jgi:hypothetical protein
LNWLPEGEQIVFKDPLKGESFFHPSAQVEQSGLYIGLGSGDFHFFTIDKA